MQKVQRNKITLSADRQESRHSREGGTACPDKSGTAVASRLLAQRHYEILSVKKLINLAFK